MLTAALVSTAKLWHGGEGQLGLLAHGLRRRGHRVVLLARRDSHFAERMQSEGFEVLSFPGRGRSLPGLWQIRRSLRRACPDLLYMNDAHALTAAGIAAACLGIPARIAVRRVDFPLRAPGRYRWGCDRLICISHAVVEACRAAGIAQEQIRLVHEGVNPRRVRSGDAGRARRALGIPDHVPLLVTVATLTDHKGHRFLLEAMPAVLERYGDVCLALAGDGELTDALKRQAAQLELGNRVRFLGFRDDVPDLIQAADLVVLPSHLEGLCTSLIDAMFAARPIVATTAGGIPDLLAPRRGGEAPLAWLVPPREPAALADALLDALARPAERAARAARALERAEACFTDDRMVAQTLAVYEETRGGTAGPVRACPAA